MHRCEAVHVPGAPVEFADSEPVPGKAAPMLGEHTREVLADAGYSESEIGRMLHNGSAAAWPPNATGGNET